MRTRKVRHTADVQPAHIRLTDKAQFHKRRATHTVPLDRCRVILTPTEGDTMAHDTDDLDTYRGRGRAIVRSSEGRNARHRAEPDALAWKQIPRTTPGRHRAA